MSGKTTEYGYDAEGLRHEMEENGKLVSFIFRGREVVAEESQEDKIRYIRTGELLASGAEYARTYYHYASDEMGSITHVVTGEGKESVESGEFPGGSVLNCYEYDAWGNLTACEETVENRFRFNGQQYDPISQQYYLRARYYNPVIGRFTQEDTYRGDGLNLYSYCRNNPVYYVDPSGHMTCPEAQEQMRRAIAANQDIGRMEPTIANQLREWAKYKSEHGGLTPEERRLASQIGLDTEGGSDTTRRQAFRQAKEAAGIPKSAEFNTHRFVFDGSSENRIVYEFTVNGQKIYIVEHPFDKMGRGNHFHVADGTKGSPFDKGRYNQYPGHFPEDIHGFK